MVASFFSGEIFGFVYTKTITKNLTPSYAVKSQNPSYLLNGNNNPAIAIYSQNGVNAISGNNSPASAVSYTNS
jgi:hypothetical protein